jgi:hypothetical protein
MNQTASVNSFKSSAKTSRSLILTFLLAFTFAAASAQDKPVKLKQRDVPEKVLKSFNIYYFHIEKPKWVMNGPLYQAEFTVRFNDARAVFNAEGQWQKSEFTLAEEEFHGGIPTSINKYLEEKHQGAKIISILIQLNPGGKLFIVAIDPDDSRKTENTLALYFAENGNYQRQENISKAISLPFFQ